MDVGHSLSPNLVKDCVDRWRGRIDFSKRLNLESKFVRIEVILWDILLVLIRCCSNNSISAASSSMLS
jgi:hypothetical protein